MEQTNNVIPEEVIKKKARLLKTTTKLHIIWH